MLLHKVDNNIPRREKGEREGEKERGSDLRLILIKSCCHEIEQNL
jgi:hypothetical protein